MSDYLSVLESQKAILKWFIRVCNSVKFYYEMRKNSTDNGTLKYLWLWNKYVFLIQEHKHPAQCVIASIAFLNISHTRIQ